MATTNVLVTGTWTKVVLSTESFLLTALTNAADTVEVAVFSLADATVHGHKLNALNGEGLTRDLIGPGDVYVRSLGGTSVAAALTTWVPT